MVERSLSMREVPGSMPGSSTFFPLLVHLGLPDSSHFLDFRSTCSGLIATASGDDAIRIFQEVTLCVSMVCTSCVHCVYIVCTQRRLDTLM